MCYLNMNQKSEIARMIEMTQGPHLSLDAAKSLNRVIFKEAQRNVSQRFESLQSHDNDDVEETFRMFQRNAQQSSYLD